MPPYISGTPKQEEDKLIHLLELCKVSPDQVKLEINKYRNSLYKNTSYKEYYMFIGINPPPNTYTMSELYELGKERTPYPEFIMTVEQNTDQGIRPHLHILAKGLKHTRKSREIPRLAAIFKLSSQCIDFKSSSDTQLNSVRRSYIKGNKTDSKTNHVEQDKIDRAASGIPDFYSSSNTQCQNTTQDPSDQESEEDDTSQDSR